MKHLPALALVALVAGCFAARGMVEVVSQPYPKTYEDDSAVRFGDNDDAVFMEVRRTKKAGRLDNLAIHYRSQFPDGETVKPGDSEEYLKIDGKNAYKVTYRPKYIRRRKPLDTTPAPDDVPPGWTVRTITEPATGKTMPVLYGPVIPQQRAVYLVEGDRYLYYIFMRADGDSVTPARQKFDEFVRTGIAYK
jgi:hypothetical protein